MDRREALGQIASVAAASVMAPMAMPAGSAASPPPGVPAGRHRPKQLPFDPRKLRDLSERLIVSHHENNYGGAVRNLNKVEEELARVVADTPAFIVGGLREKELSFTNSVILHELYFGNLGGGGQAGGRIAKDLANDFGTLGRWEEMFRATGMSLAGGSGWTILGLNLSTSDLHVYGSGNHTQAPAWGHPLLVMDMYEHAYQMDYGAAAAKYVDAFFSNINWDEVNRRLEKGRAAAVALAGR